MSTFPSDAARCFPRPARSAIGVVAVYGDAVFRAAIALKDNWLVKSVTLASSFEAMPVSCETEVPV